MKTKLLTVLAMLCYAMLCYAQVGINNTTPTATLDITARSSSGTSTTVDGLIVPRVDRQRAQSMVSVPTSTIIYINNISTGSLTGTAVNIDAVGLYLYNGTVWEKVGGTTVPAVAVTSSGFNGTYTAGTAMTASNTFTVTIANNSFSNATLAFSTSDLVLSGVTGLTVASVTPASSNLLPGGSVTVTYSLSGTPSGGTLTGTWTKLSLNTTKTASISANIDCSSGTWSNVNTPVSLLSGKSTSGTYSVPYSGGNGSVFNSESYTTDGITLSLTGFTSSTDTGNLQYNVSGTYTGTTGELSFTTAKGCAIKLTSLGSCKMILDANPGITSAQYMIDPDGLATAFAPMKAECDMTTDGGGWTLVSNYLHNANTTPSLATKSYLPIINSTTLGVDESTNTQSWGNASTQLLTVLGFSQVRIYGKDSAHGRITHMKTITPAVITAFKSGGSGVGTYTALSGNTCNNCISNNDTTINSVSRGYGIIGCPQAGSQGYWRIISNGNTGCYNGTAPWMIDDPSSDWCSSGCGNRNASTYSQFWIK